MTVPEEEQIPKETLLAFFAMVVGIFMAILDIQIVSSSLQVIGAGLSASGDELSWIQTSYLIAEVIVIPMTGFAAKVLSTRISYFIAAFGFTVMSFMCAIAWNIESMIVFRALQGFFGGAMIPTAFGVIFIIFPKSMHTKVSMIIGLVVTVAPTIGPTIGGYITDVSSWHFMFLLNIVPGVFVCSTVFLFLHIDKPNYDLVKNFDYIGFSLLIISLGAMQYVLEEGNKKDWLQDTHILTLTIICTVGFIWLIIRELTFKNPIIDLSAFANKNFTFGCIYSFILGVGLYGTVYLMPLFLFTIAGYSTLQIGTTMVVTGIFQFVSAPLAGKMFGSGIDKRIILAIGFGMFAFGSHMNSYLTNQSQFWEFFLPQMIRGLALMFCFMPINDLALGTIKKEEVQNASGLYNLTRNLGGAIGLALINSTINEKTRLFTQTINENMPLTSSAVQDRIAFFTNELTGKVDNPELTSFALLGNVIGGEAFIMSMNYVFNFISLLFCIAMLLIPFSTSPKESVANAH